MDRTDPLAGSGKPETPPETELGRTKRARAGERSAREELLRAHYARVHATAFRLLGNPEDAEDLAQECFVRAFRSLAFYRGEGSFAGWLRRILVHLVQDRYRALGKRPQPALLPSELAGGREPHGELEERELGRLLSEALLALGAPQRIALLLRTREGLEYEEIADLTGVTPATARTRVMKARKTLARLLRPYLGAHEVRRDVTPSATPAAASRPEREPRRAP
jgi:RNA polymerase sigma-70 factor (ECF subfamily)